MMNKPNQAVTAAFAVLIFCILFSPPQAQPQALTGSMVGRVTDPSGAVIVGATVRITHRETNQSRTTVTTGSGTFDFQSLPSGTYEVVVTEEGFQTFSMSNVALAVDQVVRVDAQLSLGNVGEIVEVTAEGAVLQTDRADVRTEMSSTQLENLPVPIGRNYQNLLVTIPGISPPQNMHSVAVNPARGLAFSSGGTTRNANSIRIEGAITNNLWLPHVAAYVPALDAIETVSVVTSSFDADLGLSGGMSANLQMKSGTNELHGSLFEYHFNNRLKAKPFFLPTGERKPKVIQNQFGGTLGGPIVKDKLFYFASYEATHDRQTAARFGTVPTAAIRAGDMSASPNPIYDPLTGNPNGSGRTAFPNNRIPEDRIDPIVTKLIGPLPGPTFDRLTDNFWANGPYTFTRHKTDAKVNLNATEKLTISGRLGWLKHSFFNPPMFGDLGGLPVNASAFKMGEGLGDTYTITGSFTYVVTPSFVIDSYTGVTLIQILSEPPRMDENLGLDFLGIPGTNGPDRLYGGWPQFSVTNYSVIGYAGGNGTPYIDDNWQYQYTANASWTKGSHTLRFGGDIVRQAMNRFETGAPSGTFNFAGGPTTIQGGPSSNQFNSYATFLLGLPTGASKSLVPFENNRTRSRNWQFSMFVKDQWQATSKLTASLGVRWDHFPVGTRTTRGMERYDFENNQMLICGVGNIPTDCGYEIGKGNFSPRVGLAYRATEGFVIRAGYGINFDPYPLAFVRNLLGNYPSSIGLSVPSPNSFQFASRLADGIPAIEVPDVSSGIIPVPLNVGARALPQEPKRNYIQSWNLTLQKQLGGGFVGQAGYVATRQVRINQILDLNAGQIPGAGNAGRPLFQKFGRTAQSGLLTNPGRNQYDSLQTSLQRRFSGGLQVNVAYTWSKNVGICCDTLSDNPPRIQALEFFDLNRAVLDLDRTHNFQASFVADLPFGRGKRFLNAGGVGAAVLGGWQVNGLFSAYSGSPFTVTASGTSLNLPGSNQRADQIKPEVQTFGNIGPGQSYFDPLAFAPVTEARFGTAGYNILRGPGVGNLDLSVQRRFDLSERVQMQFRAEMFNITNTPHFSNPSANVSNLQLNADGSVRNLGGFSSVTGSANTGREGLDERVFQFGLRLSF